MTIQVLSGLCAQNPDKFGRFKRWLWLTIAIIVSSWVTMLVLSPWVRIGINATDSLPGLFYLVLKNQLPRSRGDLVAFYPPQNRFYPNGMFFIKHAAGIPGDTVTRQGKDFYVYTVDVFVAVVWQ